jgi:hypothetical protein
MYALYVGIDLRHAETSAALNSILKRHVLVKASKSEP